MSSLGNFRASTLEPAPFAEFLDSPQRQINQLRLEITEHHRAPEEECVSRLLNDAALPRDVRERAKKTATNIVESLRHNNTQGIVQELMREFALSSQEGIALMCLAEALLRIPDVATRDVLIRDKVGGGNWSAHFGKSPSIFVNAATWGLIVTGKLTKVASEEHLSNSLLRLLARGGEPLVRKGVDLAMRMLGEQFVLGETIEDALRRSKKLEAKGFTYSYDMLGEAATSADDARRYYNEYAQAIQAIGEAATGRGPYSRPGISIKLSALHPRYSRSQRKRVLAELLPRLHTLCTLAKRYDLGLNIDAEEADRLDLSLDLLEIIALDPSLREWNGLGFVVQAYQKRAPFVLDFIIDLARRSERRLMVRLVKGAYWDSEIKRAQLDGLVDFPVFTRKQHTDISYLACARKLLNARKHVFPQFATHNAQTLAIIYAMAGDEFSIGDYEFQCLHGMGDAIYEEVVGPTRLNRPCRIYAPVGTHETLLAYLVRRLLENGANSSFVNRIHDPSVSVSELVRDPCEQVHGSPRLGTPHPQIALPRDLYGSQRMNSSGLDLSNEASLLSIAEELRRSSREHRTASPLLGGPVADGQARSVLNPADHRDCVGHVTESTPDHVDRALAIAERTAASWRDAPSERRAECLFRAAQLMEERRNTLLDLLVREAGKTVSNAVSEVREAVDFLRYYGEQAIRDVPHSRSFGPAVCISPWNFPLAIFTGQVAAALAVGSPAIAKPAEETPLIAAQAVSILREAGIPEGAVQLLPGDGKIGAALVADPRTCAVLFTGSTEVAKLIQGELATRLNRGGTPVPLIAETGGQNALIADSSALPEQVIADVLSSAFDSAGQRCSALRVLCLQEDSAERLLDMLRGAMHELSIGNPDRLSTDIGPVITGEALSSILKHVETMRQRGRSVHQQELSGDTGWGTFVPPTIIEINDLSDLDREVFGPVLHVLRFSRKDLASLVDSINATGYGLTFGIHSRINETIDIVAGRINAGNIYVNRNVIGATVGVQPFGGHGLSGTGPKAGGPLYLRRLLATCPPALIGSRQKLPGLEHSLLAWLSASGKHSVAAETARMFAETPFGAHLELAGPVGEQNLYLTERRGVIACMASTTDELLSQIGAAFATGNRALIDQGSLAGIDWPAALDDAIIEAPTIFDAAFDALLFSGDDLSLRRAQQRCASKFKGIVPVLLRNTDGRWPLELLVLERSLSINTAAAGGNASLMTIG